MAEECRFFLNIAVNYQRIGRKPAVNGQLKRIIFTVTNDLVYDQRMIRICTSLAQAGYQVQLVGCQFRNSRPLITQPYRQRRLATLFRTGVGFYAFYNLRLFLFLLFTPCEALCAIDLDTIMPVWLAGKLRGRQLVYDAHEYFSQQKEVISRPRIHRFWHWVERSFLPRFRYGYTVSPSIARVFRENYGVDYAVIRNLPLLKPPPAPALSEKFILYQGAVNEARGLEYLVPAMKTVPLPLYIYGDGNFMEQTKKLVTLNNLSDKVFLKGKLRPDELPAITASAFIGLNLVENNGLNQYYSLANKFFDYVQAGVPQVTMNFPEYRLINDEFQIALLIDDVQEASIAAALNQLIENKSLYEALKANCRKASEKLNWQEEEKKLLGFYKRILDAASPTNC